MVELFLEELKIYDDRIIEAIQDYYLIERLADWCDFEQTKISQFSSTVSPISNALKMRLFVIYTSLFDGRSNYGINEIIKRYKHEDWCNAKIFSIEKEIDSLIASHRDTVILAQKWRDKFWVHFDQESIIKSEFERMRKQAQIPIDSMLDGLSKLHFYINEIKKALGERPRRIFSSEQSLDLIMKQLCHCDNVPDVGFNEKYLNDIS